MAKKIIIGQSEWTIRDAEAEAVVGKVRDAMARGAMVELQLADAQGRAVSVFVNGAAVPSLVLDLDEGPRPSEMS
ncbi:hypothetical protein ODJ79_34580 [Actinoplanes sp. KI2]|uniref:hypothetical protein n=1 Tax=Actinoplanes sp. KI2 TaxID=2983315 RepID=UPI0021D57E42|nr:hypothetical protein [Actinoplanes sp. KI2]MCU7728867.1 hypothetical protein [Actinoplanes sp. KI2]